MADAMPPLSGLERLRAAIAANEHAPIGRTLDFRLVEVEDGLAVFEATPGREVYNPAGRVHGGYTATLLDSACGCAVQTKLAAGQACTTLELKVAYHRPITDETGPIRAAGTVLSIGRRAAFTEAKLTDADGRLLASATSTLMIIQP